VKGPFIVARPHSPSCSRSGGQTMTESASNGVSYVVNKDIWTHE